MLLLCDGFFSFAVARQMKYLVSNHQFNWWFNISPKKG